MVHIKNEQFIKIYKAAANLSWDVDRMSESGNQFYNELMDELDKVVKGVSNGK